VSLLPLCCLSPKHLLLLLTMMMVMVVTLSLLAMPHQLLPAGHTFELPFEVWAFHQPFLLQTALLLLRAGCLLFNECTTGALRQQRHTVLLKLHVRDDISAGHVTSAPVMTVICSVSICLSGRIGAPLPRPLLLHAG
jgi:hypothetical protein